MTERVPDLDQLKNSDFLPPELLKYWKKEIIGYYPPDRSFERQAPDGLDDQFFKEQLQTLSTYLSLPFVEDIWGLDGENEQERLSFIRRLKTIKEYEAFKRNKLRIGTNTAALLAIQAIAEYLYDPEYDEILKERQRFFDLFSRLWHDRKTTYKQKEDLINEFVPFVASVFDKALEAYNKAPDW